MALFVSAVLFGQGIDRKIIIEDDQYYCVTIDERYQIGTLHTASIQDTLLHGKALALPAGRSLLSEDKPLSWDLRDTNIYAVSFMDHPMNDRNEAIKLLSLNQLKSWESTRPEEVIMHSVDHNMLVYNDPYKNVISRSKFLDGFYFDALFFNGAYWMLTCHNNELFCWKYENDTWQSSELQKVNFEGNFSLFIEDNALMLLSKSGSIYRVSMEGIQLEKEGEKGFDLNKVILVENRDTGSLSYLDKVHMDKEMPFKALLNEFGKIIYK